MNGWHKQCADCDEEARVGLEGVWVCIDHFEARLNDVVTKVTQAWEQRDA